MITPGLAWAHTCAANITSKHKKIIKATKSKCSKLFKTIYVWLWAKYPITYKIFWLAKEKKITLAVRTPPLLAALTVDPRPGGDVVVEHRQWWSGLTHLCQILHQNIYTWTSHINITHMHTHTYKCLLWLHKDTLDRHHTGLRQVEVVANSSMGTNTRPKPRWVKAGWSRLTIALWGHTLGWGTLK